MEDEIQKNLKEIENINREQYKKYKEIKNKRKEIKNNIYKNRDLKFVPKEEVSIKIKRDNIIKIKINDENGNFTGQYLEFDMDDIELPLRLSKCEYLHRKNLLDLQSKFVIIDKQEDKKGKFLVSYHEEEKIKALEEFYEKEMKAFDLFIGEGGCKKLLNGRKPYYNMFDDFCKMLDPVMPLFEKVANNIENIIENKYTKNDGEIIE